MLLLNYFEYSLSKLTLANEKAPLEGVFTVGVSSSLMTSSLADVTHTRTNTHIHSMDNNKDNLSNHSGCPRT